MVPMRALPRRPACSQIYPPVRHGGKPAFAVVGLYEALPDGNAVLSSRPIGKRPTIGTFGPIAQTVVAAANEAVSGLPLFERC